MSLTQTSTSTLTLELTGAITPPLNNLLVEPLVLSGELSKLNHEFDQLTPAIGMSFNKSLQLKEILSYESTKRDLILKDIAITISKHGVVFFSSQENFLPKDLAELGLALGTLAGKPDDSTLHIHPTQELGENGLPVGTISNLADKDGRQISFQEERSNLSSLNFHNDISFETRPANYTLLRMHTLPKTGGDTLFSSAYSFYDMLSPAMASFLETLTATHNAEMFREQSIKHGFELRTLPRGSPLNVGNSFNAIHPVIRTNPVTGLKGLFVNVTFTSRINELTIDESDALLKYLFRLQHESHDAMVRYRWSINDLAIWDNRSTSHAATFDYGNIPRMGDRVVCVGETPYFDPASCGRKEAIRRGTFVV